MRTFGDYLRKQGKKEPEHIVPADECDIIDKFAAADGMDRQQEIAVLSAKLMDTMTMADLVDFDDGYILGEEAERARCETCGTDMNRDDGQECEGCAGFFGDHGKGRNNCWKNHNCGQLTDSVGRMVNIGDVLVYPAHRDVFVVLEMQGTWVKGGYARALRKRGAHEMPIIPRLMIHQEEEAK